MMYTRRRKGTSWSVLVGVFGLGVAVTFAASPLLGGPVAGPIFGLTERLGHRSSGPANEDSDTDDPDLSVPAVSDVSRLVEDGTRSMQAGRWQEAFQAFDRATELEPRDSIALSRGARALLNQNKSAEGLERARRAYEMAPTSAEANRALSLALDWNNQVDAAIAAGTRA